MNKYYIILAALSVLASSCQRSQFSSTIRHNKNGKVSYANNYYTERSKPSTVRSHKRSVKQAEAQNNLPAADRIELRYLPGPEILKINSVPAHGNDNLIASVSKEPAFLGVNENRVVLNGDLIPSPNLDHISGIAVCYPDTIKYIAPKKGTTLDFSALHIIKFKDGHKETAGIIYQSNDTLFFHLISNSDITRNVQVEQVDTILQVKYFDFTKGKVVDTRKTVKLGLAGVILSVLGLFPFFGLPFAILAVIFGAVSLKKINRNPELYKGKRRATTSLILGILGIAISAVLLIIYAISGGSVSL